MQDKISLKFLNEIKAIRKKVAEIYLFGSRARGDQRQDSDYDILIVVNKDFSLQDKDILYDAVMDILFTTGNLFSLKIFKKEEFSRLCQLKTPFMRTIIKEGVRIG